MEESSSSSDPDAVVYRIQTVTQESATVILHPEDSFLEVRELIAAKLGLLPETLKLVHSQRVLDVPDEVLLRDAGLDPLKPIVAVGKKAAPIELTLRIGDAALEVAVPPQRCLMSELLTRGLVTADIFAIHKGHLLHPQRPVGQLGLQSGDTVFIHRKGPGHGAQAAGDVVDAFTRSFQLQKEEERREEQLMLERRTRRERQLKKFRAQQKRYTQWKMLAANWHHPVRQKIVLLRRIRWLVLALRSLGLEARGPRRPRRLPEDVLVACLAHLDLPDVRQALRVCTSWFILLCSDRMWANFYALEVGCLAAPQQGPRPLLEALYLREEARHNDPTRPTICDLWQEPSLLREKAKTGRFAAALPEPGVLELNFAEQCVDEATAYLTLLQLHWACALRDQMEFRCLMVAQGPAADTYEWRPSRVVDQLEKVAAALRPLADAVRRAAPEETPGALGEELLYVDGQTVCQVSGVAGTAVLRQLGVEGLLDGLATPMALGVDGRGLLNFRGAVTLVAYQHVGGQSVPRPCGVTCFLPVRLGALPALEVLFVVTRFPFPDESDDEGASSSSHTHNLLAHAQAQIGGQTGTPRRMPAEDRADWLATLRGRLLYVVEDYAMTHGCRLVVLPVADQDPDLTQQCLNLGYHPWRHTELQYAQRVPGLSSVQSCLLAPYLHTQTHMFIDCDPFVKLL